MFLPYMESPLVPSARAVHPLCYMINFSTKPAHLCLRYFAVFSLHLTGKSSWTECSVPIWLLLFTTFEELRIVFTRRKNYTWCFFDTVLFTKMAQNAIPRNRIGSRKETTQVTLVTKHFSEHLVHAFFQMFPELMVLVACFTTSLLLDSVGFFHPLCVEQELFTNHPPMKFPICAFACYINFVWERGNGLRLRTLLFQVFDPTIVENNSFSFQKEEKKEKEQKPKQFKDIEFKMKWKFNQNHSVFFSNL